MNRDQASQAARQADPAQGKPQTNWLAWSLQLALGLLVGSAIGVFVALRLCRFGLASFDQILFVIAGVALCCGAVASFHGNRTWMAPSAFDCPEPPRTAEARTWSILIGYLGAALVIVPVVLHLLTPEPSRNQPSSDGFGIFRIVLAAVPGTFVIHALRTGTGFWKLGDLDREERPLFFWAYVLVNVIGVVCLLFGR